MVPDAPGPSRQRTARAAIVVLACAVVALVALLFAKGRGASPSSSADVAPRGEVFLRRVESRGEEKALDEVQKADEDPWILAEELLLLGKGDVAARVAHARLADDESLLQAYIARSPAPPAAVAETVERATALLAQGNAAEALTLLVEPATPGLTVTHARLIELRAKALDALRRSAEATSALRRLADQAGVIGWRRGEIAARIALLDRLGPHGNPDELRAILSRLVTLDSDARDVVRSAVWCGRLGRLEVERDSRSARRWLLEADGLFDAALKTVSLGHADLEERVWTLISLAGIQLKTGNPASALTAASRAYDAARASKDMSSRLKCESACKRSEIQRAFLRLPEAEKYMREAVALCPSDDPVRLSLLRGDLARLRVEQGDLAAARVMYAEVRDSAREPWVAILTEHHLAAAILEAPAASRSTEDVQHALLTVLKTRERVRELPPSERREGLDASALTLAGRALTLLDRPGEAIGPLQEALESRYTRERPEDARNVSTDLAKALRRHGETARAAACARAALHVLEEEVSKMPSSLALSRLEAAGGLIEEVVAADLATGEPGAVLDALERTRGIVFLGEALLRRAAGAGVVPAAPPTTASAVAAEIGIAAQAYARALSEGTRVPIAAARTALWERRKELRAARERSGAEEAAALVITAPVDTGQEALEPDEAMLYYGPTGERAIAVLATRRAVERFVLGEEATLQKALDRDRADWLKSIPPASSAALTTLAARVLPASLIARLRGAGPGDLPAHVYVSATGTFARLPWSVLIEAALLDAGVAPDAVPTVSLIASQRVLRHVKVWNPSLGSGRILALGNPDLSSDDATPARSALFGRRLGSLPGSEEEVRRIVDPARGDVLLLGAGADEASLRRQLFQSDSPFHVLHFACHGNLYGEALGGSVLALHPSGNDDGLLTVDEVTDWRLPGGPRLVVLAACESGLGVPIPGEGEEGFVRALLLAGARHVVASHWDVPDVTSGKIMTAFHRHFRDDHMTPAAALRRAQRDVQDAQGTKPLTPRSWAGWSVWGPRD